MFTTKWNIENYFAPLLVWLTCEILKWFFVQIVEHIKKPLFFIDSGYLPWYDNGASERKGIPLFHKDKILIQQSFSSSHHLGGYSFFRSDKL